MAALPLYRAKKRRVPIIAQPEGRLQAAIVQHLKLCGAPGVLWFHPPNEARRSYGLAASLKAIGMVAGVADLIILHQGRAYALEVKAKGGKQSVSQIEFEANCAAAGVPYACVDNIAQALTVLLDWAVIRRMTVAA